jgi:hypothetical protein
MSGRLIIATIKENNKTRMVLLLYWFKHRRSLPHRPRRFRSACQPRSASLPGTNGDTTMPLEVRVPPDAMSLV